MEISDIITFGIELNFTFVHFHQSG